MLFRPSVGDGTRPSYTLPTTATGTSSWIASASVGHGRRVTIKLANYASVERRVTASLAGWSTALQLERASVLTASSPNAENTLETPHAVAPQPLDLGPVVWDGIPCSLGRPIDPAGAACKQQLTVPLPPWSIAVVRLTEAL